jgi:hypothetical protein
MLASVTELPMVGGIGVRCRLFRVAGIVYGGMEEDRNSSITRRERIDCP